tara:strand:+ start:1413 stop:1709 length:297 start_codon:yes stop_codon:yes gene_type:complete
MRLIILFAILVLLNGCSQYSSLVGPSYTFAKSGSVLQTGNSIVSSHLFKKTVPHKSFDSYQNQGARLCETYHSSDLNEIFFETLDEISCEKDPFSILR